MKEADVAELLERQAQWQRSRRALSWPGKIREAERLRPSLEIFRRMRTDRGVRAAGRQQQDAPTDVLTEASRHEREASAE